MMCSPSKPIPPLTRRDLLRAGAAVLCSVVSPARLQAATPQADVLSTEVISHQPQSYCGWPTLARRRNGQLLLVCSGGREAHVCPFGRVEWMTSQDDGRSWTWPRVLMDSDIDDRDAGVVETPGGAILVTTFTSSAWEPILERAERAGGWDESRLRAWQAVRGRLPSEARQRALGTWMIRSTDAGVTWSARSAVPVNSPHGPVGLSDGRVLYAGKELWRDRPRIGVAVSTDDGATWEWLAEIPARPGDDPQSYHELHAVETSDGRIIAQIRNHNPQQLHETLQTHSDDGGRSWAVPYSIGVWGYPSHLLGLRDGRLLMSYGHRRDPVGNQARVSEDGGRSWSAALRISTDGTSTDLGYPSTVELEEGTLLTVWYERLSGSDRAVLRQARWRLTG